MKKILIIDDDRKNIFALQAVLKAKGYTAVAADTAIAGIAMMEQEEQIGIVLMDMMMPEMDGYEAINIIRNKKKISSRPVIAVTAQAMTGDKEKCLAAGADDYISKPIDVNRLFFLLDKFMQ